MFEMRNRAQHKAAFGKDPQASCPLAQGELGGHAGFFTTADAVPGAIVLRTPNKSQVMTVLVLVSAIKSDGTLGASFMIRACVRCNAAGVVALVAPADLTWQEADGGFAPDCDIQASGGDIVLVPTGVAVTTINWTFSCEVG